MTVVESKQSQSNDERFPEVKPTKPGSDTPYIAPIIGKLGYDTDRPWLFGLGTSPNNGVDFHVFLSFDGLNFDDNDIDKIWNGGTADKVKQEVDSATAEIPAAVSAANSAVQYAESAVAASKVNSDAIVAQSEAISEAIASATSALGYANSAMKDTAKLSSDLASASASMASETADIRKDFSDGLKSAQAAVDDVKVVVAANSAAIIKNQDSIELQQQTASSAIADLKIADGKIEQVATNASSQAVVATQTAAKAQTTAMGASSNATVAEQTASAASVMASSANDQVAAVALTASEAKVIATNASSAATSATVAASGATLTATNANSQAMQAVAQASQAAVTLTEVEKKANDGADQIKELSTNLSITQKQVAEAAKQTDLDKLTGRVTTQEAQSKILSDQMSSKISRVDMTDYIDGEGFATETYTQNLMKSTADTWDVNLTKLAKTVNDNQTASVKQMTSLQASLDGLQTTVTDNDKKTSSQFSQLSDALQAKVSASDFTSQVSQLSNDINDRVTKGDLISQINIEAGNTLIQSNKIYLDADSVIMGPNTKAFIPSAAIESLDADKITTGYIHVPMSDGNGNSVSIGNDGVDIVSNNQNTPLFSQNRGAAKVNVNAAGMSFGATTNDAYEQLGSFSALVDNTDGSYEGMDNQNGIGYVVETQQQYGSPYGGDFFSLARSIKGPPSYYNGFLYEATGSGKHEIGSHFFDPIYVHPWGADNYMHATWVSWTAWDNNEKYPAIVQAGGNMGGICFPKSGEVTLFTASGKCFTPSQWKGAYTDYEHAGPGQSYLDPSSDA